MTDAPFVSFRQARRAAARWALRHGHAAELGAALHGADVLEYRVVSGRVVAELRSPHTAHDVAEILAAARVIRDLDRGPRFVMAPNDGTNSWAPGWGEER